MCKFCNRWETESLPATNGWIATLTDDELYVCVSVNMGELGTVEFDTCFTIAYCPVCGRSLKEDSE